MTLSAATLLWLTVTAKVLSPQYLMWSIGLVALTRSRRAMVLLAVAALLSQLVFRSAMSRSIFGGKLISVVLVARNLLLVARRTTWLGARPAACSCRSCRSCLSRAAARTTSRPRGPGPLGLAHRLPAAPIARASAGWVSRWTRVRTRAGTSAGSTTSPVTPGRLRLAPAESPATTAIRSPTPRGRDRPEALDVQAADAGAARHRETSPARSYKGAAPTTVPVITT